MRIHVGFLFLFLPMHFVFCRCICVSYVGLLFFRMRVDLCAPRHLFFVAAFIFFFFFDCLCIVFPSACSPFVSPVGLFVCSIYVTVLFCFVCISIYFSYAYERSPAIPCAFQLCCQMTSARPFIHATHTPPCAYCTHIYHKYYIIPHTCRPQPVCRTLTRYYGDYTTVRICRTHTQWICHR